MKKSTVFIIVFTIANVLLFLPAAGISQTIRGIVLDKTTRQALPFSTIQIHDTHPAVGTTSDESGRFVISVSKKTLIFCVFDKKSSKTRLSKFLNPRSLLFVND